jgi:ribosome biogenesis protein BRX1
MAKKRKQQAKVAKGPIEDQDQDQAREEEQIRSRQQQEHEEEEHEVQDDDDDDHDDEAISSEEEDDDDKGTGPNPPPTATFTSDGRYHNKQRLLVVSSRGITARYRHLLEDLLTLCPHAKKESKLDVGKNYSGGGYGAAVNEIAEVRGCHTVLFLECRKKGQDGYLWLGRTCHANANANLDQDAPNHLMVSGGPSVKFHITNIHTMDELKLTGNCMKGSRPILSFDSQFSSDLPELKHLQIIKHLMVDVFGTPRGHPKSKPFVDRIMAFYYADKKVSRSSAP